MNPHGRLGLLLTICFALAGLPAALGADKKPPKRKPTVEVRVFRDGDLPTEPVKELAVFTDDGGRDEEEEIIGKFVQKAKKTGADVVVVDPLMPSGAEIKPFSFGAVRSTFAFRARAYYYDASGQTLQPRTRRLPKDAPPRAANEGPGLKGTGTGFFITEDGFFITNEHVVQNAKTIKIRTANGDCLARLVRTDAETDLALLKADGVFPFLPIRSSRLVRLGETVATIGFPNFELQGFSPKLSKGEVASLAGVRDNPKHFQVSLPVQPGNSGGPLVDAQGNVVGVVVAKLNARLALESTGMLPENVSYAIKSGFVLAFLESLPELGGKLGEPGSQTVEFELVVQRVQSATGMVLVF